MAEEAKQCMTEYHARAYGQMLCVGDTYTDPQGGSHIVTSIWEGQPVTSPQPWTAEETYDDVGAKLGLTPEEWSAFAAELHGLNAQVQGMVNPLFTNEDKVTGRLGIRVRQANPDWTEDQINAEVRRLLEEQYQTTDAYRAAVAAENALFEKYGITKPNQAVYGTGNWVDAEGNNFQFNSATGTLHQTTPEDSFLDIAVPIGIGIGASVIGGQAALAAAGGGLTGVTAGAVQGAGGAALQGAAQGDFNLGDVAQGALTGGLLAAGGDYLQDTLDGIDSDLGGLLGEGGLVGGDLVSTDGFNELLFGIGSETGRQAIFNASNEFLGWADEFSQQTIDALVDQGATVGWQSGLLNNAVTNALNPILNSKPGQAVLDGLNTIMGGYDDSWREHQTTGVDANGNVYTEIDWAAMSESDLYNYRLFEAAQQTGMWRLDEQYWYTDQPRDPNSVLTGILTKPIESGGQVEYPSAANPNSSEQDSDSTGGSDALQQGTETGNLNDDGNNGLPPGDSTGLLSGFLNGLIGNNGSGSAGPNAGGQDVGALAPNNSNVTIQDQLQELINVTDDPVLQAQYQAELDRLAGAEDAPSNVETDFDNTLPTRQEQVLGLLQGTRAGLGIGEQLPPGEDELPPISGGGAGLAGLLAGLSGGEGVNPMWGPLYDYKNISKWQKARERVFDDIAGMISPMQGADPLSGLSKRDAEEQGLLS